MASQGPAPTYQVAPRPVTVGTVLQQPMAAPMAATLPGTSMMQQPMQPMLQPMQPMQQPMQPMQQPMQQPINKQAHLLAEDVNRVANVDIERPFRDLSDAVDRLLPFHVLADIDPDEADELEAAQQDGFLVSARRDAWEEQALVRTQHVAEKVAALQEQCQRQRERVAAARSGNGAGAAAAAAAAGGDVTRAHPLPEEAYLFERNMYTHLQQKVTETRTKQHMERLQQQQRMEQQQHQQQQHMLGGGM